MRIDILTLFPELLESPFEASILKRAIQSGQASVHFHNLRDYSQNKQKQVDDYPFGGGAGMVMMVEPIDRCIQTLKKERDYDAVIYLTPDGETLNQQNANRFSTLENIILLCGHYKGVDERVREHFVTHEISVGDYVISGGELAAAAGAELGGTPLALGGGRGCLFRAESAALRTRWKWALKRARYSTMRDDLGQLRGVLECKDIELRELKRLGHPAGGSDAPGAPH